MQYPKHFIQVKTSVLDLGDNIELQQDVDTVYKTLTFTIPYVKNIDVDLLNIKKFDNVQLFYNEFRTSESRDNATFEDCVNIFNGYVQSVVVSEDKDNGVELVFTCRSNLGLVYERTTLVKSYSASLSEIFTKGLSEIGIMHLIPYVKVSADIVDTVVQVPSENNFGKVIDSIKKKYPIKVFESYDGGVFITTPSFFDKNYNLTLLSSFDVAASLTRGSARESWKHDLKSDVNKINYGNVINNINCVVVIGYNYPGVAYDIASYRQQHGNTLKAENLSVETIYRRDIFNPIEARRLAYEELIDRLKNYTVELDTVFNPYQKIGDIVQIQNSVVIDEDVLFTIKRRNVTISSSDGVNCNIVLYRTGLSDYNIEDVQSNQLIKLLELNAFNFDENPALKNIYGGS